VVWSGLSVCGNMIVRKSVGGGNPFGDVVLRRCAHSFSGQAPFVPAFGERGVMRRDERYCHMSVLLLFSPRLIWAGKIANGQDTLPDMPLPAPDDEKIRDWSGRRTCQDLQCRLGSSGVSENRRGTRQPIADRYGRCRARDGWVEG